MPMMCELARPGSDWGDNMMCFIKTDITFSKWFWKNKKWMNGVLAF
jgi:hypothetical protein